MKERTKMILICLLLMLATIIVINAAYLFADMLGFHILTITFIIVAAIFIVGLITFIYDITKSGVKNEEEMHNDNEGRTSV